MTRERWERWCVVGIGGHARTKLIPAIAANGQTLVGVVSRSASAEAVGAPVYPSVEAALEAVPAGTVFVIASPPEVHFAQSEAILSAGFDLIVEKPAFVRESEARQAAELATRSGTVLVEGFMNRCTAMHRRFLDDWAEERPVALDCAFTIPEAPKGTFRSDTAIGASNLYDISSYLLATLIDAGLPLDGLALADVDRAGEPDRERLHLAGTLDGVAVRALTGVDAAYANRLEITRADGTRIAYSPFFFGRPGVRTIVRTGAAGRTEQTLDDVNAFEAMFAVPVDEWRRDQPERLDKMIALTGHLERLGGTLSALRSASTRPD